MTFSAEATAWKGGSGPTASTRNGLLLGIFVLCVFAGTAAAEPGGQNAILVLVDGLRCQEAFGGADERLIDKELGGVPDPDALRREYWRETAEARREALMPFLWRVVAKRGQLLGNSEKNCSVQVSNPHWFSYPGWSEMAVGFADPRIDSNQPKPNPNLSVLEWLHRRPGFDGKVAGFACWDTAAYIFDRQGSTFYLNVAFEPVTKGPISPRQELLNRLKSEIPSPWGAVMPYDALTFHAALEYLKANKPRVFYIGFGETDEWAHGGRYDSYLRAARLTDNLLATLWETVQSMPEYRDRTTLIVATDHGRGASPQQWKDHGANVPGSQDVWIAAMGPCIAPLGERSDLGPITLGQVAATLAASVGEDYAADVPQVAPAIRELFSSHPAQ